MNSIMTHCKARIGIVFWIGLFLLVWSVNGSADSDDDFDEVRCEKSQIVDRKGKCKDIEAKHEKNKSKDHDRDDDDDDKDDRDKDDSDKDDRDDDDSDNGGVGGVPGAENIIALHNSSSPQYNDNCSDCHGGIHTRQTLNPLIPDAHVAMLPFAAGETDSDKKCAWCHRSVDLVQAAGSPFKLRTSLRKRVDVKLCTLCHGPAGPGKKFYQVSLSSLQLDGSELYDLTCSGCHGFLADSEVEGESVAEIQGKINENEGGMGPLGALNTDQIQAIAAALGGDTTPLPTPTPPPTAGDGVTLYAQSCATCHGDLANSDKKGASAASIQSAIDSDKGGMGSLSTLTTQQIQAIATVLAQ